MLTGTVYWNGTEVLLDCTAPVLAGSRSWTPVFGLAGQEDGQVAKGGWAGYCCGDDDSSHNMAYKSQQSFQTSTTSISMVCSVIVDVPNY